MNFNPLLLGKIKSSEFYNRLIVEKRVVLDNTEYTNWNSCFVKGLWNGAIRIVSADGQTPLLFGQAVHVGLENLMRGVDLDECIKLAVADANKNKLDNYMDPKRTTANVELILQSYKMHTEIMRNERITPYEHNGQKLVEMPFSIPIGTFELTTVGKPETIQVIWSGKIDVIWMINGKIWIVDHKTTSVMGEKFADGYIRSSQMLGYSRVAQLIMDQYGLKVEGVCINALASRKGGYEFKQFFLPMSKWKLDEWHVEVIHAVKQLSETLIEFVKTGEAVPNREHCVTKYGRCPYFDLCEAPQLMREKLVVNKEFFVPNTWHGSHV